MKHQSDSSILKSLAVAFGDGLAFGVGMKIAQVAPKKRPENAPAELPAPAPAPAPAASLESLDLQVLSKVIASLDAKLAQHMNKVEQRVAESEAQTAAQLQSLDTRQTALAVRLETAGQETQAIEAAVQAHIQAYVDQRIQLLEERLHRDIGEAGDRTAKLLVDTIESRLLDRIATLEGQVRGQAETIRTLRAATHSSQQRLYVLLAGFGRACQEAAQELDKQSEPKSVPEAGAGGQGPGQGTEKFDSLKLVDYQGRGERRLPVPLISSIAVLILGMAALGSSVGWF